MEIIDVSNWKRREHFEFFASFANPFFGIVADVNCTYAYQNAKTNDYSFFSSYLHKSLCAVNKVDEFKYRYDGQNVTKYNEVHASATVSRKDGTFGFTFIPFTKDFAVFQESVKSEIDAVKNTMGIRLNDETNLKNVIHFSSIPWIRFTGLTHAIDNKVIDSVPKISIGKIYKKKKLIKMPVSVTAHHGLVDGWHVAQFLDFFQELLME